MTFHECWHMATEKRLRSYRDPETSQQVCTWKIGCFTHPRGSRIVFLQASIFRCKLAVAFGEVMSIHGSFSPPVRWGLLDFMLVSSPPVLLYSSFLLLPPPPPVVLLLVGSQLRSCEFSVACRAPTASSWVQCGVPDLNLRAREFSVACRTPTAISWVQCGVPDPNREPVSWVWRPGPQPRSCEFSVASRTPTASSWVQCGVPDLKYCVRKFVRTSILQCNVNLCHESFLPYNLDFSTSPEKELVSEKSVREKSTQVIHTPTHPKPSR